MSFAVWPPVGALLFQSNAGPGWRQPGATLQGQWECTRKATGKGVNERRSLSVVTVSAALQQSLCFDPDWAIRWDFSADKPFEKNNQRTFRWAIRISSEVSIPIRTSITSSNVRWNWETRSFGDHYFICDQTTIARLSGQSQSYQNNAMLSVFFASHGFHCYINQSISNQSIKLFHLWSNNHCSSLRLNCSHLKYFKHGL